MSKFTRKQAITLPTLSHKKAQTYYLHVIGEMYKGKQLPPKPGKDPEPPADCLRVINMETGEEGEYLIPTLVKGKFEEIAPLVGRCFEITKLGRRDGKRYDDYSVYEIECPNDGGKAEKSKK